MNELEMAKIDKEGRGNPFAMDPDIARKAGSRSKRKPEASTTKCRVAFASLLEDNLENLQGWIDAVESPKDKIELVLKIAEFCVPRLARVEMRAESQEHKRIEVVFVESHENQFNIQEVTDSTEEV